MKKQALQKWVYVLDQFLKIIYHAFGALIIYIRPSEILGLHSDDPKRVLRFYDRKKWCANFCSKKSSGLVI